MKKFLYGKDTLSIQMALELSKVSRKGIIDTETLAKIVQSRNNVESIVSKGDVVYGVNTGFGPLCNTKISSDQASELQYNILRSHSVGVGDPIPKDIAKLMMILKVHSLARGFSGIALSTIRRIIWHIEQNIIPVVPSQGSVGASGDLAPLAHLFLPLIGLGKIWVEEKIVDTATYFQEENITPIELGPKEGLALINGTQFIAAYAVEVVDKLHNCLSTADIIGAMMIEALMGSSKPFRKELHELRTFAGNQYVASRVFAMLQNSQIMKAHQGCGKVQDPYSLRCIPQVHGASRNSWLHLKDSTQIELNSVTDNPLIFSADFTISGGNFHGQPMALPLDYSGLAAAEIGNISDRRIYLSLEGKIEGLPKLLMKNTGINSGFMLPQYTSAALVSENKTLLWPASGDSVPTSLGQEDHVSMGSISGRKSLWIINNLEKILAIELVCAAQAFDYRSPLKSGPILEACHDYIREKIDHAESDRIFADDINTALEIVRSKQLAKITDEFLKNNNNIKADQYEQFEIY